MKNTLNRKLKYMLASLFVMGALQGYSQKALPVKEKEEVDSIVMPREEFVNLLANAVRKRRYELKKLLTKFNGETVVVPTKENASYSDRRIERLEDELHQLMLLLIQQNSINRQGSAVEPVLVSMPTHSSGLMPVQTVKEELPKQIVVLGDTIPKETKIVVDDSALAKEIDRLEALRKTMNQQPKKVQASPYVGQEVSLFFANNKYNLSKEAVDKLKTVIAILKEDRNLDVMVKGFASRVGKAYYNQELSLKRADVVKQVLVSEGIAPGRVLTTYHGVDFSNRPEAELRRVDIVILDTRR